jgi:hypothetical protein
MEKLLSGLDSRVFLMNNVHEDGPVLFHVRWVMSYLTGPLARGQIKGLMDGRWNGKGKGLRYYLDRGDLKGARRTVNITDKWDQIAVYFTAFERAVLAAGGAPSHTPPPADYVAAPKQTPKTETGFFADPAAFFARIFASIFNRRK